ncbi:MAG TPA: N-acetylmuramoyl-L-alanine amidase [Pseudobacteroides sp.]|uniref:N-acetylmuramoyl-L-alanine amidase family protein n=1 Tax=Pseudobacteroides sp. TaxID=1968840 RepID=UPI002F91BFC9
MKTKMIIINKKGFLISVTVLLSVILIMVICIYKFSSIKTDLFNDPKNGVIIVDPGHGGIDGGTSSNNLLEKDINLDIAKRVKATLEARGYTVVLTRNADVSLDKLYEGTGNRHQRDLKARANIINKSNAQLFLSIHGNCHLKNLDADGAIVLYNEKFTQNKELAYFVQRALNSMIIEGKKRTTHDPQKTDTLYLLKCSSIPGILIETVFLSNARERELLLKDEFREGIANAIVIGVEKYLKEEERVFRG